MNGGKTGLGKKSNAMLGVPGSNGTLGGATHGYGPITSGGFSGIISGGSSANQNMHNNINMNINVYK